MSVVEVLLLLLVLLTLLLLLLLRRRRGLNIDLSLHARLLTVARGGRLIKHWIWVFHLLSPLLLLRRAHVDAEEVVGMTTRAAALYEASLADLGGASSTVCLQRVSRESVNCRSLHVGVDSPLLSVWAQSLDGLPVLFRVCVQAVSESPGERLSSLETATYVVASGFRVAAQADIASPPILQVEERKCRARRSVSGACRATVRYKASCASFRPRPRIELTTKPQPVQIQSPAWTHIGPELPVLTIGGSLAVLRSRL